MPPSLHPTWDWSVLRPGQSDRDYIVLWHGCSGDDASRIVQGVDPSMGAPDRDFGRGFYTTSIERMQLHGGFDMVYHENPADVAKGLSHGGILLPDAAPDERRRALLENYPALTDFFVADHDN
ncbi:MAG TPA: hypothetical protein VFI31_24460 [Pirellulales bacterium]|nr:hypothetical protein [Pirellulales bacterium]